MAQLTVITVGSLKEGYLREAVAEYKKRLSQYARVDEVELKEERINNEDNRAEIEGALSREADKILSALPKDALKIALCVEGKQHTSEELARIIGDGCDRGGKIALVIGSSYGLSEKVKRECDVRLSFSKLTFPHQLMRVVLFEAMYRSFTILHGKRYHK
ncbi:MAG: 23S rRNA (pseudouridine(1915)-N(3))-methyltransferase RlmH [Clostridia bacterium]|nr:23S rRNA (pseudouridine(1915)-N(3))-methyltransferase RlmH [Clostridia bacterium]